MKIKWCFLGFLGFVLILSGCVKKGTIADFKPENFTWSVDQQLFFKKGNKLYLGLEEEKLIYTFKGENRFIDNDVYVSPDSEKVLIEDENKLYLIDIVSNFTEEIKLEYDLRQYSDHALHFSKAIQWSRDSKKIGMICVPDSNNNDRNILLAYDVEENNYLINLDTKSHSILSFFFSNDGNSIFYKYFNTPNTTAVKEISLSSGTSINEINVFPDTNIFVNIFPSQLYNHSPDLSKKVIDSWRFDRNDYLKSGNYLLHGDTLKLLIEGSESGENFKEHTFSNHMRGRSYFLPGGRYYIFRTNIQEYKGNLILDTKTRKISAPR